MGRTRIDQYDDILYMPDIMEYLKIGRNTALRLFKDPDFPALNINIRINSVLKTELIKYLETHAK